MDGNLEPMHALFLSLVSFICFDYATYFGGSGYERIHAVAAGPDGSTFAVGRTTSFGPPFTSGEPGSNLFEAGFLARWDPAGKLILSKLIPGGLPWAIAIDRDGNAYLAGNVFNLGFKTTPGAYRTSANELSAFLMKVNPAGETVFATLFGELGAPNPRTLVLGEESNPTICGYARAGVVPLTDTPIFSRPASFGPQTDTGFCSTISADGSRLLFSTLLGGSDWTFPSSAVLDRDGSLYVGGATFANDMPAKNAYQESDRRRTIFRRGIDGVWTPLGDERFGSAQAIQFIGGSVHASGESNRWVSDDAGQHWRAAPNTLNLQAPAIVHPLNTRFLCAATGSQQLYCSSDEGRTWIPKFFFGARQVVPDPKVEGGFYVPSERGISYVNLAGNALPVIEANFDRILSLTIDDTGEQSVLWMVRFDRGLPALFRSVDRGASFRKVIDNTGVAGIAQGNSNVIYAARFARFPDDPPLRRSDDGGQTWVDVGHGLRGQLTRLVVDPQSPSKVYALTLSNGPYRSEDGGETWQPLAEPGLGNLFIATLEFDREGNLWAGSVQQPNGFLMKINLRQPALEFSTLLGAMGGGWVTSLRVDSAGRVIAAGTTSGSDLPVTNPDLLAPVESFRFSFLGRFSETGTLESLRYTGNGAALLEIDAKGRIHVAGQASALRPGFAEPVVRGELRGGGDALWLTLDSEASTVTHAMWFGGSGMDGFTAMAIGADGLIRLAGVTTSRDLPVTGNAAQAEAAGSDDAFLVIASLPD